MRKQGFTLAEVLITLSIIGVVAALTIPSLVKNYEEAITAVRARKAYSQLVQAWTLYIADNKEEVVGSPALSSTTTFSNNFIKKYFKYAKSVSAHEVTQLRSTSSNSLNGIQLKDGTLLLVRGFKDDCGRSDGIFYCAVIYIDVNGEKGPNRIGFDTFEATLLENRVTHLNGTNPNSLVNRTCIVPESEASWTTANNRGNGCLNRILQGKPKWCKSSECQKN